MEHILCVFQDIRSRQVSRGRFFFCRCCCCFWFLVFFFFLATIHWPTKEAIDEPNEMTSCRPLGRHRHTLRAPARFSSSKMDRINAANSPSVSTFLCRQDRKCERHIERITPHRSTDPTSTFIHSQGCEKK